MCASGPPKPVTSHRWDLQTCCQDNSHRIPRIHSAPFPLLPVLYHYSYIYKGNAPPSGKTELEWTCPHVLDLWDGHYDTTVPMFHVSLHCPQYLVLACGLLATFTSLETEAHIPHLHLWKLRHTFPIYIFGNWGTHSLFFLPGSGFFFF